MWKNVGIIRNGKDLEKALGQIGELMSSVHKLRVDNSRDLMKALELNNMLILSEMVCRAALLRTESRGAHYRSDYPEEDNQNWLKNIVIRKHDAEIRLQTVPVTFPILDGP